MMLPASVFYETIIKVTFLQIKVYVQSYVNNDTGKDESKVIYPFIKNLVISSPFFLY